MGSLACLPSGFLVPWDGAFVAWIDPRLLGASLGDGGQHLVVPSERWWRLGHAWLEGPIRLLNTFSPEPNGTAD